MNQLADFIQKNSQYSVISSYIAIADLLVDIINFCNSRSYSTRDLLNKYFKIIKLLSQLYNDVLNSYKFKIYFKGTDKYKILKKIINYEIVILQDGETRARSKEGCFEFNILLLSEETVSEGMFFNDFDEVITYDKLMNDLYGLSNNIYNSNYDYNFLVNAITKAKEAATESIIIGSSYPMFGIDDRRISQSTVNLSLPSQDIYYSLLIAKSVIDKNNSIKEVYLGTGYWSFHFDLSKAKNSAITRIEKVYYPIFRDSNNYIYEDLKRISDISMFVPPLITKIFDVDELYRIFGHLIFRHYNSSYFHANLSRAERTELIPCALTKLDALKKREIGIARAGQHNKLIKFKQTRINSQIMLNEFLTYLYKKKIKLIILNFPSTKYYANSLDNQFEKEYYQIIKELKTIHDFEFIDLKENIEFEEEDFVDMDHMNEKGAKKVTELLNIRLNSKRI
ncbi:hypothetical protein QPK24_21625 [Paenibacillus polygoni]|uniref:GDSL-like lipase/acylhydrolase family protein n=1 Tax=Paenibacillus polygoni TaxID=3050112 RepID=A0ABY8X075_9BACL|nr:hypothetical protein [Paenibacillus polygoni]WIV18892.1 hypothetical protein QPK24_21625 [Paenibacillus polygoni]